MKIESIGNEIFVWKTLALIDFSPCSCPWEEIIIFNTSYLERIDLFYMNDLEVSCSSCQIMIPTPEYKVEACATFIFLESTFLLSIAIIFIYLSTSASFKASYNLLSMAAIVAFDWTNSYHAFQLLLSLLQPLS